MEERLQKFLSECGISSRRGCEELIKNGLVSVNNTIIREMGVKINPETDIVRYKGRIVKKNNKYIYIMLNKPKGYITTVKDEFNRPTVMDFVKSIGQKIYPVGRLDYNSSGLLLLTNDGDLAFKLTHPGHEIDKEYIVKVNGNPDEQSLKRLQNGILIDGRLTSPAKVRVVNSNKDYTILSFIIHEGRNRQIRKMCSTIGHEVLDLKRVAIGKIKLGGLKEGEWKHLSKWEVQYLKKL